MTWTLDINKTDELRDRFWATLSIYMLDSCLVLFSQTHKL